MTRYKITLKTEWVARHIKDFVLPVTKLKDKIIDGESVKYYDENYFSLVVDSTDEDVESFSDTVFDALVELYPDENDIMFIYEVEDVIYSFTSDNEEKQAIRKSIINYKKLEYDLKTISNLIGAEEFKKLADDINIVAPSLVKRENQEVFRYQSYLFSVGEGMGMSTYAKLLGLIAGHSGLMRIDENHTVVERKIGLTRDSRNPDAAYEDVESLFSDCDLSHAKIAVIDISEIIDKVTSERFKAFLKTALEYSEVYIYIFRIPYVEKDVLESVRSALGDILNIKTVSIPPLGSDDIRLSARRELEKYNYQYTPNSMNYFMQRIIEEKSDGSFYGFNTVKKVVRELVYEKELAVAKSASKPNVKITPESYVISSSDAKNLCSQNQSSKQGYEQLDELVGCDEIKKQIKQVIAQIRLARKEGMEIPCMHMRFVGNPGTGKTTVARILGRIMREEGLLRIGNFHEHTGRELCGMYIGETAPKTTAICRDAYGSVLFIDEAYTLYRTNDPGSRDYGREAIDTLVGEMENHRDDLIVILAGYTDDMENLLNSNFGLKARVPYTIEFANFTREQLYEIYKQMLGKKFAYDKELLKVAHNYFVNLPDEIYSSKEFGNGRFVRNLFERTWAKSALRCELGKEDICLTKEDFESAIADKEFSYDATKKTKMGF